MRVGLLEDDIATREMLLLALQEEGHTAINYESAEECLAQLGMTVPAQIGQAQLPIDVLIADLRLGGAISGLEVVQRIRHISSLENLQIILMTAAGFQESELEEIRQLRVAPIEKPFSLDVMMNLIKQTTGDAYPHA